MASAPDSCTDVEDYRFRKITAKDLPKDKPFKTSKDTGIWGCYDEQDKPYTSHIELDISAKYVSNCRVQSDKVVVDVRNSKVFVDTQTNVEETKNGAILWGNWGKIEINLPTLTRGRMLEAFQIFSKGNILLI